MDVLQATVRKAQLLAAKPRPAAKPLPVAAAPAAKPLPAAAAAQAAKPLPEADSPEAASTRGSARTAASVAARFVGFVPKRMQARSLPTLLFGHELHASRVSGFVLKMRPDQQMRQS